MLQVFVFEINDEEGLLRLKRTKELKCTSMIEGDASPKHMRGLPELDSFMWADQAEAHSMVFRSQKHLFGPPEPTGKRTGRGRSQSKPSSAERQAKTRPEDEAKRTSSN